MPPRTTIPKDYSPLGQVPTRPISTGNTIHQDQYIHGGELFWWGVVRIRLFNVYVTCVVL